jgi:hypothetical protein
VRAIDDAFSQRVPIKRKAAFCSRLELVRTGGIVVWLGKLPPQGQVALP